MKEEFQPVKGTRDFLPEDKIRRQEIVDLLREVFETFGFEPLETPSLERWEILSRKYAGGDEILKETYKLKDQGGRELGLRYDLTVPLCRVIAGRQDLSWPFKRYQIGRVWRDGPIKFGRYREFWQCDVDVIGPESMVAEAELIKMIETVAEKLDFDIEIKINNRKILNGVLKYVGISKEMSLDVILSLDKLEKIGKDGVVEELKGKGIKNDTIKKLMNILNVEGSNEEILKRIEEIKESAEGVKELKEVLEYSKILGVKKMRVVPTLSRGLAYYTGTVFEAFFKGSKITSSFAAGGRYDELIGKFLGSDDIPAVGFSFGLDVICDALEEKTEKQRTVVKFFIIPINTKIKSLEILKELRESGIKTDIDLMERSISKNLNYANSREIPFCIFVGEKELEKNSVKLKNMKTGEEILIKVENLLKEIKKLK